MRKSEVRKLCGVICAVVLAVTGCGAGGGTAGSAGDTQNAQTEDAGETNTEAAAEATAPAASGETTQVEPGEGGRVLYESSDGWTVEYDSSVIALSEEAAVDRVTFNYTGESGGENYIEVTYFPDKQDQEALYDVMADADGLPEHVRSEGYFDGREDIWSLRTMVDTVGADGEPEYKDYIAVEHNGGALVLECVRQVELDEAAEQRIDDCFSDILDSLTFTNHAPQTGDEYVWGKYTGLPAEEGIEGQPDAAETFVLMNADHTGTIHLQDDIPIIWYRRDGVILNAQTYEQIYEYVVEGDMLYLENGEQTLEFQK